MRRQRFNIACIITCVTVNTIPRWLPHIPSVEYGNFFCKMQALSFLLMTLGARSIKNNRYVIILWEWATWLAFNNFFDEALGNPLSFSWVEKTFGCFITLWTIYRIIKCTDKHTMMS